MYPLHVNVVLLRTLLQLRFLERAHDNSKSFMQYCERLTTYVLYV